MIRFASYNVMDLYKYEQDADELARYDRVYQVIREFDADVIAIQELIAEDPDKGTKAADRLEQLSHWVRTGSMSRCCGGTASSRLAAGARTGVGTSGTASLS
jgi:endonuclease/exonuclease/phosphatase family metal-dependent hydrolase